MFEGRNRRPEGTYEVSPWEFNVLLLEVVCFGGVLMAALMRLGPRVFSALAWPEPIWAALGFFVMGLALYPALRIAARNSHGRQIGFAMWLAGDLLGAAVGLLLYYLLR